MPNILVSNVGFGAASPQSLTTLQSFGKVILNKEEIRFNEQDFIERISDANILIAGINLKFSIFSSQLQ